MSVFYFSTKELVVGYDNKPLIKNIDIGVNKGEILSIIGPNGAGKSTVLKSIAKQLESISGCIYLDSKDMQNISSSELSKKMAVLFTDRIKGEMMSCEEVVAAGRYPYTGRFGILSENDKKIVEETMKTVGIYDLKDSDYSKISDGQKQRVLLAKVLCQEPQIILLDEPTSFLDIRYKLEFFSVIEKMKKEKNLTVIMSLHELELAKSISDKVLCLKGEYVDRFGTVSEIFDRDYICELFGINDSLGSFALDKNIGLF